MKRTRRLIVLMMLDSPTCELNVDDAVALRHYLSQYTYIDYTADDWLDKLLYALPLHGLNVNRRRRLDDDDDVELLGANN